MGDLLINEEEDYNKYLQEVDILMDKDPDIDSIEGHRLLFLARAIKEYESKHFVFKKPSIIEAVKFRFDERGLKSNNEEKEWRKDIMFWEGFDAAINLVDAIFCNYKEEVFDDLWCEIEEEVSLYKTDG